jgi:hypothetical protein
MVTQILFGELYHVTGKENTWFRVKLAFDDYEGWIDSQQAELTGEPEFTRLLSSETSVSLDLVQLLSDETGKTMIPLVLGSSLPGMDESRVRIGRNLFFYDGSVSESILQPHPFRQCNGLEFTQQLIEDAMLYMNAPYLWGGRTPFGIDCSGFVQMAYKLQGIKILRDASQQATMGEVISLLAEAEPGDLAFFDDLEGNITHVGMLIDRHRIIHCSGNVHIDTLDHEGIYNESLQKYTHKLRLIKRLLRD